MVQHFHSLVKYIYIDCLNMTCYQTLSFCVLQQNAWPFDRMVQNTNQIFSENQVEEVQTSECQKQFDAGRT